MPIPDGQECGNCRFADDQEEGRDHIPRGDRIFLCRRNPPAFWPADDRPDDVDPQDAAWPIVLIDNWCGEWQAVAVAAAATVPDPPPPAVTEPPLSLKCAYCGHRSYNRMCQYCSPYQS